MTNEIVKVDTKMVGQCRKVLQLLGTSSPRLLIGLFPWTHCNCGTPVPLNPALLPQL